MNNSQSTDIGICEVTRECITCVTHLLVVALQSHVVSHQEFTRSAARVSHGFTSWLLLFTGIWGRDRFFDSCVVGGADARPTVNEFVFVSHEFGATPQGGALAWESNKDGRFVC